MIVFINDVDTINLGLIPLSKDIPSPKPKLYYIDVPGRNGKLDVTEHMGEVKYENIDVKVEFESYLNDSQVQDILRQFNGMFISLRFETKKTVDVYRGRLTSYSVKTNKSTTHATITIDASPEVEHVDN